MWKVEMAEPYIKASIGKKVSEAPSQKNSKQMKTR
jgi:hypothetical protein